MFANARVSLSKLVAATAVVGVGIGPLAASAQDLGGAGSIMETAAVPRVGELEACSVVIKREHVIITDLAVVNDPVRTRWTGKQRLRIVDSKGIATTSADGAWHFGQLMTSMAGTTNPSNFVKSWLQQWDQPRVVNGLTVPARVNIRKVIDSWPKLPNGELDLTKPPMRLLAIVNRFDLRQPEGRNKAGEGRFVFGVLNSDGSPMQFTVILEYNMPTGQNGFVPLQWARWWGDLSKDGAAAFGDVYRTRLQQLTDRFTMPSYPLRQNASAIAQVRTNEIALAAPWELREFKLTSDGNLRMAPPARTPANQLDMTTALAQFLTDFKNSGAPLPIDIPLTLNAAPFRAGAVLNNVDHWRAPFFTDSAIRHNLSLNTCNGCHGRETQTTFLHISPRQSGQASVLSGFLSGKHPVPDPVTGVVRVFDEIRNRRDDLKLFLCRGG